MIPYQTKMVVAARYQEIFSHLFDAAAGIAASRCLCSGSGSSRCLACKKDAAIQEMVTCAMDVSSMVQEIRGRAAAVAQKKLTRTKSLQQ